MDTPTIAILRDMIVLAYLLVLRVGVPLVCIVLLGKWIQAKMAQADMREQRARLGEPYCWDEHRNAQTERAHVAAAAYPDLPCWLAVQQAGAGLTDACFHCARYVVRSPQIRRTRAEVD